MTWAQLRQLYLQATADSDVAREEDWIHLSQGHRDVVTDPRVQLPELMSIDPAVVVTAAADFVAVSAIDFTVFAIASVFNTTDGFAIYPEPGGMLGRQQYLQETTGKPPDGVVTHYIRDGANLYVRNTPTANTTLQVRALRQVADLTIADLNNSPLTPVQYDMAIVHAAAASFYALHETPAGDGETRTPSQTAKHRGEVERILTMRKQPLAEEDRPRRETMRLRGYRMYPRSR